MNAPASIPVGPAQGRYQAYAQEREPFLDRARRISRLTITSLFREMGDNGSTSATVPWQTLGAYGVNNLSAKLVMVLFPPGIPFINLKQTKKALRDLQELDEEVRGKLKAAIDKGLSGVEQEFIEGVEEDGDRWRLFDALRHMVVGGNHCLGFNKDATLKSLPLEQYVTARDKSGNLREFVIEEPMSWETLPDDIQALCKMNGYEEAEKVSIQAPVNVYTHGQWKRGKWRVYQECYGQTVPGSEWTYNDDALPYLFLRMVALKGEHYGRSYCEDYEGDLQTLDGYWQLLTEGAAGIARLVWLVKSGATTNKKLFAEAANGATITGDPDEVAAARSEKGGDLAFALQILERLEARIARIFILNSAIQRNGERVTAEEIRLMARELETTLGGVYSNQVTSFQAPYARLKLASLQRQGRVVSLPKGTVNVTILTGDAALGRMQKAQSLDEFLGTASQVLATNSPIASYVSISNYLERSAANRQVDTDGLILSEEAVQAKMQQQQTAALGAQVAPEVVRQAGGLMQGAQEQQQAEPAPVAAE